ncbi:hypothetical protein ES703_106899 [subsurface metagenome]
MIRRIKYLIIFFLVSYVIGHTTYQSLVNAKHVEAVLGLGMWAIASFLVYGVYVGWIKTGADVVARDRHLMKTGHAPMTRDDEILSQYTYFLRNTIESLVSDKDNGY